MLKLGEKSTYHLLQSKFNVTNENLCSFINKKVTVVLKCQATSQRVDQNNYTYNNYVLDRFSQQGKFTLPEYHPFI